MRTINALGARALARLWRRMTLPRRCRFLPHVKTASVARCSPDELVLRQFAGDRCLRLDLFMRVLLLDETRDGGADGRRLYERYRVLRPTSDKSATVFLQLLDDVRRNGFDDDQPVTVARDGSVTDGAHRLACAIHLDLPDIAVRMVALEHAFYAVPAPWFLGHGFDRDDVARLEATAAWYRRRALARTPPSEAAQRLSRRIGSMSV